MKKYCLALDLKEDKSAINAYDDYHKKVWPEVKESLKDAGILDMEIYRTGNRLFMIIKFRRTSALKKKRRLTLANPKVQEWETLMSQFQKPLAMVKPR